MCLQERMFTQTCRSSSKSHLLPTNTLPTRMRPNQRKCGLTLGRLHLRSQVEFALETKHTHRISTDNYYYYHYLFILCLRLHFNVFRLLTWGISSKVCLDVTLYTRRKALPSLTHWSRRALGGISEQHNRNHNLYSSCPAVSKMSKNAVFWSTRQVLR